MKIIALASSAVALPCLHFLQANGMLSALVCPNIAHAEVKELQAWAANHGIKNVCLSKVDLAEELNALIITLKVDLVVVYNFPYQIPANLLTVPPQGFINIHFSKLPAYRGPSPVFWQIRNGESTTGISISRLDEGWDTGEVLRTLEVPIFPGETNGLCTARLSQLAVGVLKQVLPDNLSVQSTIPESVDSYYARPTAADCSIEWDTQSASAIEHLVNACNPYADGAVTSLNKQPVQIIEVSPADLQEPSTMPAGTIIYASIQDGLFVGCADGNALRINVLKTREGILSGGKAVALGIKQGMKFEQIQNIIINQS